jgi:hypothetical protein
LVERLTCNEDVAGSTPVTGSEADALLRLRVTHRRRLIPDSVSVDGRRLRRLIRDTPWMRELRVTEQRYQAVLAVISDGETIRDVAARLVGHVLLEHLRTSSTTTDRGDRHAAHHHLDHRRRAPGEHRSRALPGCVPPRWRQRPAVARAWDLAAQRGGVTNQPPDVRCSWPCAPRTT